MRELPILFSTDMVEALLEGRKTQTRRVITAHNTVGFSTKKADLDFSKIWFNGKYGIKVVKSEDGTVWRGQCKWQKGDHLWVRESFAVDEHWDSDAGRTARNVTFKASPKNPNYKGKWKPSIHMPKKYARIWVRVEDVWAEQVQDVSLQDAFDEGIEKVGGQYSVNPYRNYLKGKDGEMEQHCSSPVRSFQTLWDSINADRGFGWEANPFVWAVKFTVLSTGGTIASN